MSELVDAAPEEIGIAPDLLDHADLRTAQRITCRPPAWRLTSASSRPWRGDVSDA